MPNHAVPIIRIGVPTLKTRTHKKEQELKPIIKYLPFILYIIGSIFFLAESVVSLIQMGNK